MFIFLYFGQVISIRTKIYDIICIIIICNEWFNAGTFCWNSQCYISNKYKKKNALK